MDGFLLFQKVKPCFSPSLTLKWKGGCEQSWEWQVRNLLKAFQLQRNFHSALFIWQGYATLHCTIEVEARYYDYFYFVGKRTQQEPFSSCCSVFSSPIYSETADHAEKPDNDEKWRLKMNLRRLPYFSTVILKNQQQRYPCTNIRNSSLWFLTFTTSLYMKLLPKCCLSTLDQITHCANMNIHAILFRTKRPYPSTLKNTS